MIIEISDYDGIISLVNADKYRSFISENWEIEQLKDHFIDSMNTNSIIVWQTNNFGGSNWNIEVLIEDRDDDTAEGGEFTKSITVTDGKLYFAEYTDLTMAAQYERYSIPAEGNARKSFEIENGTYNVQVKRLFDPEDEDLEEGNIDFEIRLEKAEKEDISKATDIFWWTS